jgi:uncharacterized phage protein (TIGR02218 family)
MKTLSAGMLAMLASGAHTLAWGMQIVRSGDGDVSGWTGHDAEVEVEVDGSPLLLQTANAIDISSISRQAGMGVDNLEATVLKFDDYMTKAQLLEGFWDASPFYLFEYDWKTPANGIIPWIAGTLGNMRPTYGGFVIEMRCHRQWLQQDTTRITQANCDRDFGGPGCDINLAPHTYAGSVTSVTSQHTFTDSALAPAAGTFNEGRVNWLTGENAGRSHKIRAHGAGGVLTTWEEVIRVINVGDTFNVIAGCPRTRAACIDFLNILNFRGFDQKATVDALTGGAVIEP